MPVKGVWKVTTAVGRQPIKMEEINEGGGGGGYIVREEVGEYRSVLVVPGIHDHRNGHYILICT